MYVYTKDELDRLGISGDLPENIVVLPIYFCPWEEHRWRLETMGPDVFMAVCDVCGKRTMAPEVLHKLLDDFTYERRWGP